MSTNPPSKAFKEAAEWLAVECQNRQHGTDVTDHDALSYVDADVISAWVTIELGLRTPQNLCMDVLEHATMHMTDAEAVALLKTLPRLNEYVAHDLSYEAQKIVDAFDPTDAEMARGSFASWVDDPLIGDRRALARSYR